MCPTPPRTAGVTGWVGMYTKKSVLEASPVASPNEYSCRIRKETTTNYKFWKAGKYHKDPQIQKNKNIFY